MTPVLSHHADAAGVRHLLEGVADKVRATGRKVTVAPGDVSSEDDVKRVVAAGVADHGKIDILINNAGISDVRGLSAENYDADMFRRIFEVDTLGHYVGIKPMGSFAPFERSMAPTSLCS